MRNKLVPVLLLATIAFSAGNNIPILSIREVRPEQGLGAQDDNIYSNKQRDIRDILFKIDIEKPQPLADTHKIYQDDLKTDNNDDDYNSVEDNNYDMKGFRKEQWHNYPRQLERQNHYIYHNYNADKRNLDPDDPGESMIEEIPDIVQSNEVQIDDNFDPQIVDEADKAAAIMNPLVVLKIHLACLKNDANFDKFSYDTSYLGNKMRRNDNEDYKTNEENPKLNVEKVKREGKTILEISDSTQNAPKNQMNKRIFSLWSRLQSLNHRGHELHHRRHLYALYGLPDSEGGGGGDGGVLTAETRATFMRPPGSPLRWG